MSEDEAKLTPIGDVLTTLEILKGHNKVTFYIDSGGNQAPVEEKRLRGETVTILFIETMAHIRFPKQTSSACMDPEQKGHLFDS